MVFVPSKAGTHVNNLKIFEELNHDYRRLSYLLYILYRLIYTGDHRGGAQAVLASSPGTVLG